MDALIRKVLRQAESHPLLRTRLGNTRPKLGFSVFDANKQGSASELFSFEALPLTIAMFNLETAEVYGTLTLFRGPNGWRVGMEIVEPGVLIGEEV